ncbi:CenpB-DNA-bind-domain-containing protein [Stemphylium lycopersici]|uniref:CenpB-DNA-bind-domain-containing protein n=1 Tax=Stemphylium lycopersici TaxID=183478 RepID=A0A364MRZ2_STELY|nr:CenpB-DNA-bind-domain-containing protein [Stemphylium lycopersici]RAR01250.1 CenpB-DNA-bind-domain-containing protein [Stemphylium lycopersici]
MAEHASQPVDIPCSVLPVCSTADTASVSNTSIGHFNALTHFFNATKDPYRCGPQTTVSKVLRQKEKYLYQDDDSRSPMNGSKGKPSDIEHALSKRAINLQKQGLPPSDVMIQNEVPFFAKTVDNSESHLKANSNSCLKEFRQINRLMAAGSMQSPITEGSEGTSNSPSNKHTTDATSPTLPGSVLSATALLEAKTIEKSTKIKSPNTGETLSHLPSSCSQISTLLPGTFTGVASSNTPSLEEAADAMTTVVEYFQSRGAAFQEESKDLSIMKGLQRKLQLKMA